MMKLVSTTNPNLVFVKFDSDGKAQFLPNSKRDRKSLFETELQATGVEIPAGMVGEFGGKRVVTIDDPEFRKAFAEVYYNFVLDKSSYVLVLDPDLDSDIRSDADLGIDLASLLDADDGGEV
ncbi:MAG: hypothetical protein HN501_02540 [Waddliaceae bacterium]|jgi:hypothetical protein|nr:hypothetical protein [Waddliaceae bacterium]